MKGLVAILLIWVAIAAGWAFSVGSEVADGQQALPETDPLITACAYATQAAEAEGLDVLYCRRESVEVVGNQATVVVLVKIDGQPKFRVTQRLFQTTWDVQTFTAELYVPGEPQPSPSPQPLFKVVK